MTAACLKVPGVSVFSAGPMGRTAHFTDGKTHIYRIGSDDSYRKILVRRHRLRGAVGVGKWPESLRIQRVIAGNWAKSYLEFKKYLLYRTIYNQRIIRYGQSLSGFICIRLPVIRRVPA